MSENTTAIWQLIGNGAAIALLIAIIIFIKYITERDNREKEKHETYIKSTTTITDTYAQSVKDTTTAFIEEKKAEREFESQEREFQHQEREAFIKALADRDKE